VIKDGYHGDTNMMYIVGGETSILANRLCKVAQEAMYRGMAVVKPGATMGDIGNAFNNMLNQNVLVLYVNIVVMVLVLFSMTNHKFYTTVNPIQA
jgi:Methionine aminopeptidase